MLSPIIGSIMPLTSLLVMVPSMSLMTTLATLMIITTKRNIIIVSPFQISSRQKHYSYNLLFPRMNYSQKENREAKNTNAHLELGGQTEGDFITSESEDEKDSLEICHVPCSSPEIVFVQLFSRNVETRFL